MYIKTVMTKTIMLSLTDVVNIRNKYKIDLSKHENAMKDYDDEVLEIDVDITANITPYDPGVCSGPVERCYPPEGGDVDDIEVMYGRYDITDCIKLDFESDLYTYVIKSLE